jgi:3-dehydroquinate dehydratase-2
VTQPVYVLNGPNLNLLGKRQPEIYGRETLADVEAACRKVGAGLGLDIRFHQSNREYEIIDWIHEARETAAGIVINPAAFTHTSVAILDALKTLAATGVIAGLGTQGYALALQRIAQLIGSARS